ncbi:helix-turn-helix domain-containing protein [Streptomyces sp. WI04-05B]|uniref:helix-turn-helix domain-containing protein n=1 Tax=Streptomyces TaxID=1883 RepID=UPI0029B5F62B|nr:MULTISPECIES: helix-turn-helix transcriptional regulator [unclassified Streptomyces]MDX2543953.1 helix-turn-helix transcriptional regulator [Streptomyces sp. WI04-05B]MDX2584337.1 helix-turn-helix transcriptional regulator [Streptomyces sp. WI04-05A]
MSAWQPLPDDLPPEVRHFVEQVRLLKDRTGLSLAALGARTAYSKSSWQRYLNATQPPPRQAIAALCRVAGLDPADAERFAVRLELAVRVWPRPPAPDPAKSERQGGVDGGDGVYEEEVPTLPWWVEPGSDGASGASGASWEKTVDASRRVLLVAVLLALALALVTVVGAVAFG